MQSQPATRPRFQTKQEFVYQTLRAAIMGGELAPGERLRTEEIAQRLGVSPIPVRDALQALQSEGLVDSIPHVGARVARISQNAIIEVFTVMEGLELVATRTAAAHLTSSQFEELTSLLTAMDEILAVANFDEWGGHNTAFHCAIADMTAMPMLQGMTARAFSQWDRIRRYYLKGALTQRLFQAQEEHHLIVRAMHERDYPLLDRLVKIHNQGALADYVAHLAKSGPPATT